MSQLLAPTHTLSIDSIPLGRRINEIMMEKGAAYTISAMSRRLEINRETLRLMLKGEREIYTFELEKIAEDLKVPVERILQSDIAEERLELDAMINTSSNDVKRIKQLAERISEIAVGYTERCISENALGCAYLFERDFVTANKFFYQALPDAQVVYEKFGDATAYLWLMFNLMNIQTRQKDYKNMKDLLIRCDAIDILDHRYQGILSHYWALVLEEWDNDIEGAREKHYESLHHYLKTDDPQKMGIAYTLVAQFEYRQTNYERSLEYFTLAFQFMRSNHSYHHSMYVRSDYAKLLIRQNRSDEAIAILCESIELANSQEDQITEGHYLLLLSMAKQDPSDAEEVLNREIGTISIQKLACQFIIEHARQCEDIEKLAAFEQRLRQLRRSPIDSLLFHIKDNYPEHYLLTLLDHCIVHRWMINDF